MNTVNSPKVRGNIIKVPDNTPGILFADGQQKFFTLSGTWKSPVAPAVNMVVDVEFDGAGSVAAITVVDPQQLAKERLNQLSGAAQEHGKQAAELAKQGIGALAARMGKVALGATGVLWVAWFFLPAVSLTLFAASKSFTFWEFLGLDLSNPQLAAIATSHGVFSLIGLVAIAAPIAAPFIRHARAKFLNAMPLAYLVLAWLRFRWDVSQVAGKAGGLVGDEAKKMLLDIFSVSYGIYVLVIVGLVLAVYAFKSRVSA